MDSKLKRASLMPETNIKKYAETHVYVFDDIDIEYSANQTIAYRKHVSNCHLIKSFYEDYVNCELHSVCRVEPSFNEERFMSWWKEELEKYERNVLVIVYFHGEASGRGAGYTWKFYSRPRKLNARKLFELTDEQKPDIQWILDCPFATRFLSIPDRTRGHSDYMISGQLVSDVVNSDPLQHSDYTYQLTRFLSSWVQGIELEYRYWKARKSIPEILAKDQWLASNPLRLWERKTRSGHNNRVYRFCIDPQQVRRDGFIEQIRVRIQGPAKMLPDGLNASNDNSDGSTDDEDEDDDDHDDDDGDEHANEGVFIKEESTPKTILERNEAAATVDDHSSYANPAPDGQRFKFELTEQHVAVPEENTTTIEEADTLFVQ